MRYLLILILLAAGCETTRGMSQDTPPPLGYSMLPADIDYTSFDAEEDGEPYNAEGAPEFDPVPFEGCSEGADYQKGVLVSEKTFAEENIKGMSERKKYKKQVEVLRALRQKERPLIEDAEKAYQTRIVQLEKEAQPDLWERVDFQVGLGLGVGLTILLVAAINTAQYGSVLGVAGVAGN
jgi:hypothetical protein